MKEWSRKIERTLTDDKFLYENCTSSFLLNDLTGTSPEIKGDKGRNWGEAVGARAPSYISYLAPPSQNFPVAPLMVTRDRCCRCDGTYI